MSTRISRPTRSSSPNLLHPIAWLVIAVIMALQPPREIASDTKLDLVADPAGFLAAATSAYSTEFTLGQLQNQAYGYLFPQGAFFLLTDPLPDWIAQRLWWTIVVGVGFSGLVVLLRRLRIGTTPFQVIAAAAFALSPRTLTTLTAISSETWPVMLAPWVLVAVLSPRLGARAWAAAVIPVALMGAVNATATLLACLPAGIALGWRLIRPWVGDTRARTGGFTGAWLAGCAAVSVWWIGPLLILGRYSPPFTDFIESSFVTTRWLNLAEILRGTTSWSPFVDTERTAGALLVAEPVFVLITMAIAAAGVVGLCLRDLPLRGLWLSMLLIGVAILGAAHGPFGAAWLELLDGPLAPFRNLHKADPLVRIPLLVGLAHLGSRLRFPDSWAAVARPSSRHAGAALVALVAVAAVSPALSARLLPTGTWQEVPDYWVAATDYLNEHAADTRTLITPEASFARQDWGWTRDEPAQPLLDVPWAVRDAIPLVTPEAIRGLDGLMTVLEAHPETAAAALPQLGIGAVLVRHDLDSEAGVAGREIDAEALTEAAADVPGAQVRSFGAHDEIEVIVFDPDTRMSLTSADPITVAGGGESLALLDTLTAPGPRELVAENADIVTDTPMAVARNYGTLQDPVSAPLADPAEGADVRNRVLDYPSVAPRTRVAEHGAHVAASSSAADATSFGGADPARSVTAAVDKHPDTAWWPAPGAAEGQWLELTGDFAGQERLRITPTEDTEVTVSTAPLDEGGPRAEVALQAGEEHDLVVPGPATGTIRVTLASATPVGIAELRVDGHEAERVVTVPDSSPDVRMFAFQRLLVDTGVLIRDFTAPREMTVAVDADEDVLIDGERYAPGDEVTLSPGVHRLDSEANWVTLTQPGFSPSAGSTAVDEVITPGDTDRILTAGLSANEGLRAQLDGVELTPRTIGAGMQGFVVPAGVGGAVSLSFAGDTAYRSALLVGGVLLLLVFAAAVVLLARTRPERDLERAPEFQAPQPRGEAGWGTVVLGLVTLGLVAGIPGLLVIGAVAAIRRFTLIPAPALAGVLVGLGGAWLARSPWPSPTYAGDELILQLVLVGALACLLPRIKRDPGPSMNS